jgi:hypothetical protein
MTSLRARGAVALSCALLTPGCAGILGIDLGTLADSGGDATTDATDAGDAGADVTVDDGDASVDAGPDLGSPEGGCSEFTFAAGNGACETCLQASCCGELSTCSQVATCVDFATCMFACSDGDETCVAACENRPQNPQPVDALLSCRTSHCASACGTKCGGRPTYPSTTCQTCLESSCCDAQTACFQNADCVGILSCGCAQGDVGCLSGCETNHAAGTSLYSAYATCEQTNCSMQCVSANQWSCATPPPMPIAPIAGQSIGVTLGFTRLLDPGGTFSATVAACSPVDISCTTPIATTTTDATGHASLTLPPGGSGFQGYFQLGGAALVPSLVYLVDPPLVDNGASLTAFVFTTEDQTALASQTSTTIDPTRGVVLVSIVGCDGSPGIGVSFSVSNADASSKNFYLVKGTATTTVGGTDPLGTGGVLNVPASGGVMVTAKVMGTVIVAQQQVMVRAGTMTIVRLSP